ncbi:MAG: hypothetical protein LC687_02960 [Actinobacteria bacterium]|nr:hypothetical protein [Actinomycetota bacterium]
MMHVAGNQFHNQGGGESRDTGNDVDRTRDAGSQFLNSGNDVIHGTGKIVFHNDWSHVDANDGMASFDQDTQTVTADSAAAVLGVLQMPGNRDAQTIQAMSDMTEQSVKYLHLQCFWQVALHQHKN